LHNNYTEARPKLRADIVFGPAETRQRKTTHYVNDRHTDQFYRIGEKEYFLLSRMDGQRTLGELAAAYQERFGRPLVPASWAGLFKLLDSRQMLDGKVDWAKLDELKADTARKRRESQRWYFHRFRLVNPDPKLDWLLARARFIFRPVTIALALLTIVGVEAFVLLHARSITGEVWATRWVWSVWPICMGLWLVSAVLHETAHGLTCKYFGGRVTDMGVMWRYLWFYPYCKLDHTVLFHNRRHRIYVFAAGTFVNLLFLTPFALMWWLLPAHSLLHIISARLLIIFNISSFINLIPFVQLDGYFILAAALGMSDLRREAHAFLKKVVTNQGQWDEEYTSREKLIYGAYGPLSFLMSLYVVIVMPVFWYALLTNRLGLGPATALAVLLSIVSVGSVLVLLKRRARRRFAARLELQRQTAQTA
jgi:putative peptide zinc metalloprotease protein